MTDEYNSIRLHTLPEPQYIITATDSKKDQNTGQVTINRPKKSSETGGLRESLVLAQGARVMLSSNLDVADGLVNGARGKIGDFQFNTDGSIKTIFVKFDNPQVGIKAAAKLNRGNLTLINKIEAKFAIGRRHAAKVTRCQFPLQLAWASTIHKVQCIANKIVVSFEGHFGPGQAYVALSRVKSIDGLHQKTFSSKKIICSSKVHQHMTELRSRAKTTATDSNNDEPGHQPDETAFSSDTVDHHSHDENTASHTSVQQATWRQQLWCRDIVVQENRSVICLLQICLSVTSLDSHGCQQSTACLKIIKIILYHIT